MFGDCTVACTYLPPANRPENHLRVRLRRAYPGQPFVIRNFAADGGSAAEFLDSGRARQVLGQLPRLHVALIRYGINDRKAGGVPACIANLSRLCDTILAAFPKARLVIETGIYVDYPAHYLWDRNARLAPLYAAMIDWAAGHGHAVLDVFGAMRREMERGNWDLRIRGIPTAEFAVVDESFDAFFGSDPAFFTNIHPNSRCLALVADWQVAVVKSLFGATLPI